MTEVESVMPEGKAPLPSPSPTQVNAVAGSNSKTATEEQSSDLEKLNADSSKPQIEAVEPMEVDEDEDEDEDVKAIDDDKEKKSENSPKAAMVVEVASTENGGANKSPCSKIESSNLLVDATKLPTSTATATDTKAATAITDKEVQDIDAANAANNSKIESTTTTTKTVTVATNNEEKLSTANDAPIQPTPNVKTQNDISTNDVSIKSPASTTQSEAAGVVSVSETNATNKSSEQINDETALTVEKNVSSESTTNLKNDELKQANAAQVNKSIDEQKINDCDEIDKVKELEKQNSDPIVKDSLVSLDKEKDKDKEKEQEKEKEKEKENSNEIAAANNVEKPHDNNIVDLADDTDDDVTEVPKSIQKTGNANGEVSSNKTANIQQISNNNTKTKINSSSCLDSDGAVVINSDSETEATPPSSEISTNKNTMKSLENSKDNSHVIEDDDDDCVVIEDDTPPPTANDVNKRKSLAIDSGNNSDDSQPPNKRVRNTTPTNMSQITIKDARSLLPQDIAAKRPIDNAVYPINITPAVQNLAQGPPKLVPVGSPAILPLTAVSIATMNNNANLLPGLTDDMFVLEAPSFIVPYIYEKPPADSLKNIVKDIEKEFKFTKEDLAEADKIDDFDMITEQNKEDKETNVTAAKKKKRRGGDDGDESWSEQSDNDDDDDDDEDSEYGTPTKVLIKEASDDLTALKGAIKPAAAVVQSVANSNLANKSGVENYFESPLGKFFMDIGVGLIQEFVQADLLRLQKRKMRKTLSKNITEIERAVNALSGNLEASKKKNAPFKFTLKRCEFCNFKSESALAMANHYETPHMNGILYKCNFCSFEIRNATEIVYHMEAIHNIKARLIKPLPYHQCPNCGFEDNGKAKLARHHPVCAKKFRPELNLAPPNDWEAPAKIPRIKPRHGLVGTANAYQAMAAQAAAQKAALASIQQQQQQAAQARNLQAAALAAQNAANKYRGRATVVTKPGIGGMTGTNGSMSLPRPPPSPIRSPIATNVVMPNNYQPLPNAGGQIMPNPTNMMAKKTTLPGQPSISITPLPRQNAAVTPPSIASTSKMPPVGMKPGQAPTGNKTQFVICEICDGYIKDLEQLRNHMQWMHKVKIHPKMIYNRPPLNCQKCQFRFFTDQGLERHLLGSHGLVTSSMQEAANKGKDAGRCPVCGRMYQWKLLNHVSRDHHMTLKPAHLSYKCTVCTATFGMYKQFETHVYTAHSTVAKKAIDGKKNNAMPSGGATSGNNQRGVLSATNDSLLKPLKINDEITIIPQPSSKPRITNMESHVID